MTITANLADGRVLNFPDGTDPQVIQATVKRLVTGETPTAAIAPEPQPLQAPTGGIPEDFRLQRTGTGDIPAEQDFVRPLTIKQVVTGAIENTPKSAGQFVKDIITPFLNPVETADALAGLAVGVGEKLVPGRQENEQVVDDLVDAFRERYGGVENIKRTLAEDPVGFVADVSSLLVPGGQAVKGVGVAAKAKEIGKVGAAITKAGRTIEPLTGVAKTARATARKLIPEDLPSELFQSAAKFSTTIPEAARVKLTRTALDNRIMPTLRGLDQARGKINEFNDEITNLIDRATETGKKVPVQRLFAEFGDLKRAMSAEPITRQRQIGRVAKEIGANFKRLGKKELTAKEAQQLKQAIYRETEGFYSSVKNSPARIDAKQAVARAAKESIEDIFPEIRELNRNEGSLIALRKELEKSASRISNRDLLGIGVPIKGGAGGAIGGLPGLVGGAAIGLFDTPQVKAKLAIVLNSLRKKGVVLPEDSMFRRLLGAAPEEAAISARQAGRLEEFEPRP